jgi:hypothetical protein
MRRREILATAAAATATGCVGPLADDGGSEDGPEATMVRFMGARDSGDTETVNSLLHENGELPEVPEDAELDVQSVEVQETEVLDQGDGRATVRVVVRVRPRSPDAGERTEETEWELRTQNGDWRIWNRTDEG